MENNNYQNLPYAERILSRDEQRELVKMYRTSRQEEQPEILLRLLGSNWKLVYTIARRYVKSLELNTAMSVGFIGLIRAIEKIDLDRNTSLTTVAYHWIKMELTRAANSVVYTVPVPEYVFTIINKRLRDMDLTAEYLRSTDNPAEIFSSMYTFDQLSMYYAYNQKKVNLSCDNEHDDGTENFNASYEPVSDPGYIDDINVFMDVQSAVAGIGDDRIREIMIAYYDLDRKGSVTLEALGERYKLTKERIRQLITKGKSRVEEFLMDYA